MQFESVILSRSQLTARGVLPNIDVKGTMRSVLGERIVALGKSTGRNLKRKIAPLAISPLILTLSSSGDQAQIGKFVAEDDSEKFADHAASSDNVDKDGSTEDPDDEGPVNSADKPRGLIYARVSSRGQLKGDEEGQDTEDNQGVEYDEGSIEGQIDELIDLANNEGIELPHDPITDEAKTGTNFDRDGIQEVFEIAKRKQIDYLLVEKVDRIGRSAPETLYFIYILQSECEVTLLTPSGERDVNKVEGLMQTTLLSLMAEVQNEIRTNKADKEKIRGFLHKKNWLCGSPKVPLGYELTDDGWLEVVPEQRKIVRDLFRKFVECKIYAETERYIENKYGSDILVGHTVKTLLTNSVYIGKPRLSEDRIAETTFENNLEDQSLNLLRKEEAADIDVSEETFKEAQEIINEISEKQSTDDDTHQLIDFIEEFSLFAVIEGSEPATLLHHCGEPLVTDGQRDLKGRTVHRYRCRECEESEDAESYYRQWPRQYELDKIQLIHDIVEGESDPFEDL